jgi:hypothetical protein
MNDVLNDLLHSKPTLAIQLLELAILSVFMRLVRPLDHSPPLLLQA